MTQTLDRLKTFGWRWGPALALMAVIYWASATPSRNLPDFGGWDTLLKKGGHALGYALLAAAYQHGLRGRPALAVLLAGLYALTDEFHQTFTAGRTPSGLDVLIDTTGAIVGAWLWWAGRAGWAARRR